MMGLRVTEELSLSRIPSKFVIGVAEEEGFLKLRLVRRKNAMNLLGAIIPNALVMGSSFPRLELEKWQAPSWNVRDRRFRGTELCH